MCMASAGGVIYAPLGYGLFSLDSSSASDNIAAEGGVLASGMAAGDVTVTSGSRMDNNTAQQACSIVCGWVATGLPPAHYGEDAVAHCVSRVPRVRAACACYPSLCRRGALSWCDARCSQNMPVHARSGRKRDRPCELHQPQ